VVTVTSTSYNSLKVSYPAVAGASGYEISYSLSENGTYTKLPLTTSLSANITNTQTNRTVYVKVRAYRTVNYVKIYGHSTLTTGKSIPSAPTLSLASGGYDTIKATWSSVTGATGYQLYVLEGSTYKLLSDTTLLTYSDTGKKTGQDVTYKVRAYRSVDGVKVFSNETSSVGRALPAVATNTKVSASNVFALTLSWTAVPGATGYEISQSTSSTGTYAIVGDVGSTTFTKSSLSFNKVYYYKVRAYTLVGSTKFYGPLSSAFSGKTALLPVSGVTSEYTNYNANRIAWQPVEGAAGYAIYFSKGTSTSYTLIKYQTATTLIHSALTTNTKYNYKVRAYRMVGTTRVFGPYSDVSSSTPLPLAPVISVTSAGYNSVNVNWPAVAGATGYEVSYSSSQSGTYTKLPLTTKLSVIVPNLSTNVPVYVKVRAYRVVNYVNVFGSSSPVVSGIPVPSAPVLSVTSGGFDSINLSWAGVAGASGYQLFVMDGSTAKLLSDTATLSYTDRGLISGATMTYKIKAYRMVGDVKVFGPETTNTGKALPASTTGFRVSLVDVFSLSLAWNAVEGASGYEITQATSSTGTYTLVGDVKTTEFKKTGLTFNTTYYYKIRAYTLVNSVKVYGATSAVISGKTVPSPVVLTVTPQAGRINALTWEPVNGAAGYQIYYSTGTSTSYSLLATVTTSSYAHKSLTAGTRYNYRVRAYRMSGTTRIYGAYSTVISGVAIN
jgi:fibronectin type 3 domain-containing protein